ncbi:hypothetical protein K505DRAFT_376668 [Melanomma pulvis-pyrius CBS 109.77]|uniref:Mid2 domain-containing protein n=1 Tax=Melanomma pulvis-pyrius CBS 109.77 TaxID=1314802 RepID=A0A6A6X5P7_9PLEO|nr:hypothetical protein K505DRAFT_376668 [Melanomma pulvis-pyrius CBS 109.77]
MGAANLAIVVLFLVASFLPDIIAAINVPRQAPNLQRFLSLGHDMDQTPNATSLDDETFRDTDFLPISSMRGSTPWHLPRLFPRQNCIGDQNKCFAGSDDSWCGCDAICCTNTVEKFGYCCTSVKVCDIPNSACMDPVVTTTVVITTTSIVYNYYTTLYSISEADTTTVIISSLDVVTISSADTATVVDVITISSQKVNQARGAVIRPATPASQPASIVTSTRTATTQVPTANTIREQEQKPLGPLITPKPPSPGSPAFPRKKKRTVTSTVIIGTSTVYSTSSIYDTSTVSYTIMETASTTTWQTTTTFLNAKTTVHVTSFLNLAQTQSEATASNTPQPKSTGGGEASSSTGLTKASKIGIGVGAAAGSLITSIVLAFYLRRRRKNRKAEVAALISQAVAAATAAGPNPTGTAPKPMENYPGAPQQMYTPPPPNSQVSYPPPGGVYAPQPGYGPNALHGHEMPATPVQHLYEMYHEDLPEHRR